MSSSLAHRGPDDQGIYTDENFGMGVQRLAILDLSPNGHMPMQSADRRYVIVHNGEVYNFHELRQNLESRGFHFHSNSDTEVILNLYAAYGTECIQALNGMYAFAIWDSQEKELLLVRDRMGVKPLFYTLYQGVFYFASEIKALAAAGVPLEFDHSKWSELLIFRYTAGEETPYKGIRRLLPGHWLKVRRDGSIQIQRWWNLSEQAQQTRENLPSDAVDWFYELLDDSVRLRRISDVPVGILLSGGLDSASIATFLARQACGNTATFTVRFERSDYDEGPLAREVADRLKLNYHELYVQPEQVVQNLEYAARLADEPLAHSNDLYLLAISRMAKPLVSVLLSGEGADETLCGYVRYQPLRYIKEVNLLRPFIVGLANLPAVNGRIGKLSRFLRMNSLDEFILYNACDVLPRDVLSLVPDASFDFPYRRAMLGEASALYPQDPVRQAMYMDQHTFLCSVLDRNDRMTMGASIECREPFLDYRIVQTVAALPTHTLLPGFNNKPLLRRAIGNQLPPSVRRHRKWGFGVPWKQYFRTLPELRERLADLPSSPLIQSSPIQAAGLKEKIAAFQAGDDQFFPVLLQMFMVSLCAN